MIWYLVSSVAMSLAGAIIYIYYDKKGQFKDLEDVKYQIFHDEKNEEKK